MREITFKEPISSRSVISASVIPSEKSCRLSCGPIASGPILASAIGEQVSCFSSFFWVDLAQLIEDQ